MTALIDRPALARRSCEQDASRRPGERVAAQTPIPSLTCENVLGAGEGNRTPIPSLGSSCSTIELHPRGRPTGRSAMKVLAHSRRPQREW